MTHNLDSPVVEEIFKIKHRASKSSLAECIDLFVEYLEADLTPSTTTPAQDVRQALTSVLKDESNGISIVWLEEFDSAILASKDNLSSHITIDLIYLDGWTCPIMSDVQGGRETVATSCHSNTFCLGQVSSDEDSFRKISKIISAPSFNSWWKIKDVPSLLTHIQSQLELTFGLKCEKTSHGLPSHVIKNKRGALWSLVMEVIKVITNDHLHGFFKEMEVDFYLWLLKTMGFDMRVPTHHIDAFVLAHGIASQKCAELADTDDVTGRLRDLSNLVDACKKADNNAIVRLQNDTNTNDLPWPYPAIRLPAENDQCLTFTRNVAEVLKDVSSNLGALPPFPLNTLDPRSIITWLSITSTSTVPARARLQLMVSSVEQWFFEAARNLGQSSENPSLLQSSITLVEQILVAHRINCVNLRLQSTGSNLMEVESRSLEVLCVWISHCLVHAAATREHPLLLNYDVALKCSDLHLLVFSEKAPTDAVLAVAAYLKSYKKSRPMIFSLSDQSGTFRMAKEFSLSNPSILSIWDGESRFAEARKDENYMNVQKKQRTAAGLRVEIAEREQKLEVLRSTLEDLRIMILPPAHELKVTRHQIDSQDRSISHCQKQLRTALKSPQMVYLPLPEDKDAAMTVLFFCHMPDNLRTLGRLTFMAQQMLLPRDPFSDTAAGTIASSEMVNSMMHYHSCIV